LIKFSLHYSFQTLDGDWRRPYLEAFEQIRLAEQLGYYAAVVAEHHYVSDGWTPSAMVVCGALAAATSRIKIGTDIVVLPLYDPVRIAEDAAVVDVISGGRFIFGVGIGNRALEYQIAGRTFQQRKSLMDESLPLIRRLLTETHVTHNGQHYKFTDLSVYPRCLQNPAAPIWVAAEKSDYAVRRAARYGDGWILAPMAPLKAMRHHMTVYKDELNKMGKNLDSVEIPLRREAFVAETGDLAWSKAERGIKHLYGEDYFGWGALRDDEDRPITPENSSFEDFFATLRKRFAIGSPEEVINQLQRYIDELKVNHFILRVALPGVSHRDVMEAIRLLASKVLPQLREAS
jgi:alkanesulfonate monooxygenase SsuD/methylene tetrahydromethanopterin reductase-like flavin-dependent oxidoreductase (luciferase family)